MEYKAYDKIIITTNKYKSDSVVIGTLATILEVYDDNNYEVQFYDRNGKTIDFFAIKKEDFKLLREEVANMTTTGEKPKNGVYTCTKCEQTVTISNGDTMPPCPKCSGTTFRP